MSGDPATDSCYGESTEGASHRLSGVGYRPRRALSFPVAEGIRVPLPTARDCAPRDAQENHFARRPDRSTLVSGSSRRLRRHRARRPRPDRGLARRRVRGHPLCPRRLPHQRPPGQTVAKPVGLDLTEAQKARHFVDASRAAYREALALGADLIHDHTDYAPRRGFPIPIVRTVHGPATVAAVARYREMSRRGDRFIAISRRQRDLFGAPPPNAGGRASTSTSSTSSTTRSTSRPRPSTRRPRRTATSPSSAAATGRRARTGPFASRRRPACR